MVCALEVMARSRDAAHLAWLVEAYLEEFFILYDVPMTPNLHHQFSPPTATDFGVSIWNW